MDPMPTTTHYITKLTMTSSGANIPPMFNDTDKFDRTNWPTWSNNILSITALKGVSGYLDDTINKPTKFPTEQLPETPWNSLNPSKDEWKTRNA